MSKTYCFIYRSNRHDDDFDDARGRKKSRDQSRRDDRESSVCRDVDKDPSVMRKPDTEEEAQIKR